MALEVARRLIDGVWRTLVADEANGGGGSLPSQWTVDPDGALEIAPDTLDTQEPALAVRLPAGASSDDAIPFRVYAEGDGVPLDLDSYGNLALAADRVDPSNGGGALKLRDSDNNLRHFLEADNGTGVARLRFFAPGTAAPQQILARPSGDAGDLWDILAAYGLVAAP